MTREQWIEEQLGYLIDQDGGCVLSSKQLDSLLHDAMAFADASKQPTHDSTLCEGVPIVKKHRRQIELSPGIGKDCQFYALLVCDDILNDLHAPFRRAANGAGG